MFEDYRLLGYDALLVGILLPTFCTIFVPSLAKWSKKKTSCYENTAYYYSSTLLKTEAVPFSEEGGTFNHYTFQKPKRRLSFDQ